jgi:hypothetical protein
LRNFIAKALNKTCGEIAKYARFWNDKIFWNLELIYGSRGKMKDNSFVESKIAYPVRRIARGNH